MAALAGLKTPVLFLVFNRPEPTRVVFESIRAARPSDLYVAGDGPRPEAEGDVERSELARRIATEIDWDCNLHTRFQEHNMGPGPGVSSAITWFFENVEEGIILEDDCTPSRSFYQFCSELLHYYRDEPIVMHISGHNYQYGRIRGRGSYYFSKYTHVGGWATWRRAWQHYEITLIPVHERGEIWDAAWLYSVAKQGGVAALPNWNLVTNIGFGSDATHTKSKGRFAFVPTQEISFPLVHPDEIAIDRAADTLTYYANFRNIPDLRLMWVYQVMDFLRLIVPRARKLITRVRGGRRGTDGS
jgi:hypothetical protein